MRNQATTTRRIAVVVTLTFLALFGLHAACPPDAAHHGPVGASSELCHHGEGHNGEGHHDEGHHVSPASHTQSAVQTQVGSIAGVELPAVAVAGTDPASQPCPRRSEYSNSGRTRLIDLGISRT